MPSAAIGIAPNTNSTEVRDCERCSASTEMPVVRYQGRVLMSGRYCDSCVTALAAEREAEKRREAEEAERRILAKREEVIRHHLSRCGANPWEHGDSTLDGYDTSESGPTSLEATREFVETARSAGQWDPVRGLYLFGPTGAGKTHLAVGALRSLILTTIRDPDELVFDHAARLITEIQDTYSTRQSVEEVMERRINARVWFLDDFGTEQASADAVRKLTVIFNERAMRPTLVTSNLAPHEMLERSTSMDRIVSRLGPAYFRRVRVQGSDRRQKREGGQ